MAAVTEAPPRPGTGLSKKRGGLPTWTWVVGGVAVLGVAWFWWKNRQASAGTAAGTTTGGTSSQATSIIPVSTGLSGRQFQQLQQQNSALWEAIQDLQGEESKELKDETGEEKQLRRIEAGQEEEEDEERKQPERKPCRPGYHFEKTNPGTRGVYKVKGGWCVPDGGGPGGK